MVQDKTAVDADGDEVALLHARVSLSKFLVSSVAAAVKLTLSQEVNDCLKTWDGQVKRFEDYGYIRQRCENIRDLPDGS